MAISLNDVQRGYDAWAAKPHNAKWVRKIDGTPIANDIVVNIFEAVKECSAESRVRYLEDRLAKAAEALERQGDNMAFIINHATLPDQWLDKFSRELDEDRATLSQIRSEK